MHHTTPHTLQVYETSSDDDEEGGGGGSGGEDIMDLEDMGKVIRKGRTPRDPSEEPKEMVTPQLRQTLTKQGLSSYLCWHAVVELRAVVIADHNNIT